MAVLMFLRVLTTLPSAWSVSKNFLATQHVKFPFRARKGRSGSHPLQSALASRFQWVLPCGSVGCQGAAPAGTLNPCALCGMFRGGKSQTLESPLDLLVRPLEAGFSPPPWQKQSLIPSWETTTTGLPCCSLRRITPLPPPRLHRLVGEHQPHLLHLTRSSLYLCAMSFLPQGTIGNRGR